MTFSSSQNNHDAINLNAVPSAAPEVWGPHFLSPNGPVTVIDFVMLSGTTATAVAAVRALRSKVTILQQLLKDNKKKVRELKEENKGLKKLVDSYANDLVARSTEQSKTTTELQKQYERLLVERDFYVGSDLEVPVGLNGLWLVMVCTQASVRKVAFPHRFFPTRLVDPQVCFKWDTFSTTCFLNRQDLLRFGRNLDRKTALRQGKTLRRSVLRSYLSILPNSVVDYWYFLDWVERHVPDSPVVLFGQNLRCVAVWARMPRLPGPYFVRCCANFTSLESRLLKIWLHDFGGRFCLGNTNTRSRGFARGATWG
uniref:Uncharacterized protein n=1 Tax=Fagus sylvatica TaxID=28930 RepID=A0A2N9IS01_FAGSY